MVKRNFSSNVSQRMSLCNYTIKKKRIIKKVFILLPDRKLKKVMHHSIGSVEEFLFFYHRKRYDSVHTQILSNFQSLTFVRLNVSRFLFMRIKCNSWVDNAIWPTSWKKQPGQRNAIPLQFSLCFSGQILHSLGMPIGKSRNSNFGIQKSRIP